ncbi:MAG TPA: PQQ-binding-like beta-propeller repeat protein, partial [Candidatus Glassbacteria bacterium]|nr:PQQ-binding-like beta-propeller repeat protein [Candidatus Glassbacteria bacterium]
MLRKLILLSLALSLTACGNGPEVGPLKPHIAAQAALVHDWPHWGGDEGGARFSPLDQINRSNVAILERAWTYHTGDVSDGSNNTSFTTFECTPLVIDDTLYITTPYSRAIALEAETGRELWAFDPQITKGAQAHWMMINRGVASWKGGGEHRIFLPTMDGDLWCLNSADGRPVASFGESGRVAHGYLGQGGRKLHGAEASPENLPTEWMGSVTSAPVVYKDIVIVGGQLPYVRAYSAVTGELVWERSKVPAEDDPNRRSWEGPGLEKQGSSFSWAPMSVDSERGLLFMGTDSPTPDFYGGERRGDNRPCNSIMAL